MATTFPSHEGTGGPGESVQAEGYRRRAELCRVLTDPKRLMIIDALRHGERSVTELAAELGCTMPNTSQHLTVLRGAGLVTGRREGTTIRYRLTEPQIAQACDLVAAIAARLHRRALTGRTL